VKSVYSDISFPEEALPVNSFPDSEMNSAVSSIVALRQAWLAAVKAADADRLAAMVTEDVVIVHGNGRCVCGREDMKTDLLMGFQRFMIDQKVSSAEVIVRGKWAFDIDEVESTLSPVQGGEPIDTRSKTVVVLAQQPDASWRVARVLGLLDSPPAPPQS
jgi:uncharacterized protein (TIGR02246 family)